MTESFWNIINHFHNINCLHYFNQYCFVIREKQKEKYFFRYGVFVQQAILRPQYFCLINFHCPPINALLLSLSLPLPKFETDRSHYSHPQLTGETRQLRLRPLTCSKWRNYHIIYETSYFQNVLQEISCFGTMFERLSNVSEQRQKWWKLSLKNFTLFISYLRKSKIKLPLLNMYLLDRKCSEAVK